MIAPSFYPIRTRHDPIGYTYEAGVHCPECAFKRFGRDENGWVPDNALDREGNAVWPIAPWDEVYDDEACEDCWEPIE